MIITIDGGSATGKSTIARKVAEKLGWHYFDTGAMYRAVTYGILRKKISLEEPAAVAIFLEGFLFDSKIENKVPHYFLGEEDITEAIRTPEVNAHVSLVAANPEVRKALLLIQRNFGQGKKVVFEGRDMGTTVFPNAEFKFFLTARSSVRAERRYLELRAKHPEYTEADVLANLMERDQLDANRTSSPLRQAEDAHLIDTSDLKIDDVVERILARVLHT